MRAICLSDRYDGQACVLPTDENKEVKFDDLIVLEGWYSICKELVGYSITVGQEYVIYGMMHYDGLLHYLVQDDDALPVFVPHSLMKVCDNTIPFDWSMNVFELENGTLSIIGYNELVISYKAMCELVEQKGIAVRHFLEYKAQAEKWQ